MNKGLYRKLALNNIKKNMNTFLPFSLSGIAMTAMFYMLFNIIRKMLLLLELTNVALFIGCTAATVAIFAIVYAIVYSLTAKTYYRITYSN